MARGNAGPLAVAVSWDHVRIDGAFHAGYVIAGWPRLDVTASWMETLVLEGGGVRTVCVELTPVAPSRSQRRIDRDSVRLATDETQRSRQGFRITASHDRAVREVGDREKELVAGYAELEFVGFVIVTAPDLDTLRSSCADYEQAAARAGLDLRRLDGRHDLALTAALPVARGLTTRRFP